LNDSSQKYPRKVLKLIRLNKLNNRIKTYIPFHNLPCIRPKVNFIRNNITNELNGLHGPDTLHGLYNTSSDIQLIDELSLPSRISSPTLPSFPPSPQVLPHLDYLNDQLFIELPDELLMLTESPLLRDIPLVPQIPPVPMISPQVPDYLIIRLLEITDTY
jgi:hypothetical protein